MQPKVFAQIRLREFEKEGNVVVVERVASTAASSPNEQQSRRPTFGVLNWKEAIFFGRQKCGPLLEHVKNGGDPGHGPEGDDGA